MSPLAGLYALGWWGYQATYALGLKRAAEPHCPVVTVGNLLSGGSGKTPVTLAMADLLRNKGREVVVSTSGYGSPSAHNAQWAPDGELNAAQWGDEPAMLRWLRPELPLVVGRDRVMAARLVHERAPGAVMLMDDGFQHLRLKQHLTIVLDPPVPNRLCLPAGPYREPRSTGRRRADLVLPDERFSVVAQPPEFRTVAGDATLEPGRTLVALCAIARPHRFRDALVRAGFTVRELRAHGDHDPLGQPGLFGGLSQSEPLVVTAKDWVKLRSRNDLAGRWIVVAVQSSRIEPADAFADHLTERLDGVCR